MSIQENNDKLFDLTKRLSDIKKVEKQCKEARIEIEKEIIAATGFSRPKGQQSFESSTRGGFAEVTLKQPVTVYVNESKIPSVRKKLGSARFKELFRVKHSVVARELTKLEKDEKDIYLVVADILSSKPGKVSVNVKSLEVR